MYKKILSKILPDGSKQRIMAGRFKQKIFGTNRRHYARWIKKIEPTTLYNPELLKTDILFSVVVPAYNTPNKYIFPLIESLLSQTYPNWELIVADGSTDEARIKAIQQAASQDSRIKYHKLTGNGGISANTNEAISLARGNYIAFVDHDDVLAVWALAEVRAAIEDNPQAELIYSDEDKLTEKGKRTLPFFKPDWSPVLLRCVNYMAHFVVVKTSLVNSLGGLRSEYDGAQDYDFVLRAIDKTSNIIHIPKILYHWRMAHGSTARSISEKSYAAQAGKKALEEHLKRNNIKSAVKNIMYHPTNFHVSYELDTDVLVSIIIPFKDKIELLKTCITSIKNKTKYANYEIILVSNNSSEKKTFTYLDALKKDPQIHIYKYDYPFNYSAVNNFGRSKAQGDVLIFLNNDTKILNSEWIYELASAALRPEYGAVGAMLLYEDKTIQHAGIVLGMTGMAGHVFRGLKPSTHTPFGLPNWPRNYLAVTGACIAIEAKKFDLVSGFNEDFIVCGSDVTLCLDLHKAGYQNVYWPQAKIMHYESKSVGSYKNIPPSDYDISLIHYRPFLARDPYYNPNLDILVEVPTIMRVH